MDLNAKLAELREELRTKRLRAMEFLEKIKAGTQLTTEERAEHKEIDESIGDLEAQCTDIQRALKVGIFNPDSMDEVGLSQQERKDFSLVKLIRANADKGNAGYQEDAALELEATRAAAEKMNTSSASLDAMGFFLPAEIYGGEQVARDMVNKRIGHLLRGEMRDLNVGTGSAGGFSVATELMSLIELLRNASALDRAGITVLPGLIGDLSFPRHSGSGTGYWLSTEGGAPTESQQTLGQVNMTPKTAAAYTDYTRQLLLQSSFSIEGFVRGDLTQVLALLLDLAGLYGSGASGQPTGLDNTTDVGAVAHSTNNNPTWAEVVEMRSAVASDNALVGNPLSITDSTMIGTLMTTAKDAGSGQFLMNGENDTMMGRPVVESNQVTDGDIWYGVWNQLILGLWGTLDVLVDPYSLSTTGTTRIVAMQSADFGARHPESFCKAT